MGQNNGGRETRMDSDMEEDLRVIGEFLRPYDGFRQGAVCILTAGGKASRLANGDAVALISATVECLADMISEAAEDYGHAMVLADQTAGIIRNLVEENCHPDFQRPDAEGEG